MHFKEIFEEIYRVKVYFYWDCSLAECHKHIGRKLKIKKAKEWEVNLKLSGVCFPLVTKSNPNIWVIWLSKKWLYELDHEITHLVWAIFRERGVVFSEDSEPFAYYHEFWLRKLWGLCKK